MAHVVGSFYAETRSRKTEKTINNLCNWKTGLFLNWPKRALHDSSLEESLPFWTEVAYFPSSLLHESRGTILTLLLETWEWLLYTGLNANFHMNNPLLTRLMSISCKTCLQAFGFGQPFSFLYFQPTAHSCFVVKSYKINIEKRKKKEYGQHNPC